MSEKVYFLYLWALGGGGAPGSIAPPGYQWHYDQACLPSRLSHDYLTGEVSQLSTKVKQLEKKCKKSPEDLKAQLKTFLGVSLHSNYVLSTPTCIHHWYCVLNFWLFSSHSTLQLLSGFSLAPSEPSMVILERLSKYPTKYYRYTMQHHSKVLCDCLFTLSYLQGPWSKVEWFIRICAAWLLAN